MSGLVRSWSVGPGPPVRQVRKVERPRPLKNSLTLEDTVSLVGTVTKQLEEARSRSAYDRSLRSSILNLSHNLKRLGPQVEAEDRDALDRLQVCMRAACKDEHLDLVSRVHLLELIELRAMAWNPDENVTNYYKLKLVQIEAEVIASESPAAPATAPVQINPSPPHWGDSPPPKCNKTPLPTSPSPVRNSTERSIIEDPQAGCKNDFCATVTSSAGTLTITGASNDLVRTAKRVLHQYFSMEGPVITGEIPDEFGFPQDTQHSNLAVVAPMLPSSETESKYDLVQQESTTMTYGPESTTKTYGRVETESNTMTYGRVKLLELAKSPLCKLPPPDWDKVMQGLPSVVKAKPGKAMASGPARQLIERAVDELARQEAAKTV